MDIDKDSATDEKEELDLKIEELKEHIESDEFKDTPAALQPLLKRQLEIMQELSGVYDSQIAAFPEEEKKDDDDD